MSDPVVVRPKPCLVSLKSGCTYFWCRCGRSANQPFCDGTHTNLPGGSPLDDPASPDHRRIPWVTEREGPRIRLNGACYVVSPGLAEKARRGDLTYSYLVTTELGAIYQTQ